MFWYNHPFPRNSMGLNLANVQIEFDPSEGGRSGENSAGKITQRGRPARTEPVSIFIVPGVD